MNVAPRPGVDSAVIVPPCRSTILRHSARPIPVPGYSPRPCRRSNTRKIRPPYCGSKPIPLSLTVSVMMPSATPASIEISGSVSGRRNLIAFEIRFWNSWRIWTGSQLIVGSSATCTTAPDCSSWRLRSSSTSCTTWSRSAGTNGRPWRVTRENLSKSSISVCIRAAAAFVRAR